MATVAGVDDQSINNGMALSVGLGGGRTVPRLVTPILRTLGIFTSSIFVRENFATLNIMSDVERNTDPQSGLRSGHEIGVRNP